MDNIAHIDVSKDVPEIKIYFTGGDHDRAWDLILLHDEAQKFIKYLILLASEHGGLY